MRNFDGKLLMDSSVSKIMSFLVQAEPQSGLLFYWSWLR